MPPRSRAAKQRIVEAAVPDLVSETREGMDNIADAIRTAAGALCQIAAGAHTKTKGEQREFGAVLYEDARTRFADVARKLDPKMQAELEKYIDGLCKGKR